ncbi:monooxygenase [Abortiporus biennis]|nr:monooxygenase [Abortiporus biennis]
MTSVEPQVLVVGSGPAGLVLALTLAQNGIPLRIIEKRSEFHQSQRGAGVQARSLELYNFLGVYGDIHAGSMATVHVRDYKFPGGTEMESQKTLSQSSPATPDVPIPNPRLIGQDHAESILRSHLAKLGVEVERSTELVSLQQDKDGVTAEILKRSADGEETSEMTRFEFLVGADGAKGVTRKQLGLTFAGETTPIRLLVGDVFVKGISHDAWHNWRPSEKEVVILRPTETEGLFYIVLSASDPDEYSKISASKENVQEFVHKITDRNDIIIESIKTLAEFNPSIRMVNKFSEGRAFVVGDAAHVHSPVGGQGMNSSIQDAFNLGWKLSLVCKKLSPLSILDSYNDERLPVIKSMLAKTTVIHKKMMESSSKEDQKAAWERPKALNQLRVNCRWSSILVDEQLENEKDAKAAALDAYGSETDDNLRAGDRAPDAPELVDLKTSEKTSLFSIFKPAYHTVLLFNPPTSDLPAILESLATWPSGTAKAVLILPKGASLPKDIKEDVVVLEDTAGHAAQYSYKKIVDGGFSVVIIRPDGVIGGVVKGAEGLKAYQNKLFAA